MSAFCVLHREREAATLVIFLKKCKSLSLWLKARGKGHDRMDEMVEWHHLLNGHEFEQIPGDSEGWGSLACCSPWGCKELDTSEGLNNKAKGLII